MVLKRYSAEDDRKIDMHLHDGLGIVSSSRKQKLQTRVFTIGVRNLERWIIEFSLFHVGNVNLGSLPASPVSFPQLVVE